MKENKQEKVQPEQETHYIDESYRMDDNSDFSEIALSESDNIDDPLIPGVGVESE